LIEFTDDLAENKSSKLGLQWMNAQESEKIGEKI
jgi:hypothetical protein